MASSTETVIRFVLPGTPRAKERPRHRVLTRGNGEIVRNKNGKPIVTTYTPKQTGEEEFAFRMIAAAAMEGRRPFEGEIELKLCAYRRIPESWSKKKQADALADRIRPTPKPDIDNTMKLIDGMKGVVWIDDAQVTDAHIFKRYSDTPRIVVEVRQLDLAAQQVPKG